MTRNLNDKGQTGISLEHHHPHHVMLCGRVLAANAAA